MNKTAEQILELIKAGWSESDVIDKFDNEVIEWLDDDWEDEFDNEYDAYQEQGRGEAEDVIITEMINWYEAVHNNEQKLEVELMLKVHELINNNYDCLSNAG